jgi:glycosyltransferase involved in cell wall biosynthesis
MPELLGLVLLEAMACGTPGVCSTAGGMPEFVRPGETGLVVPWGDPEALGNALREIVSQPAWAERLGMAARTDVEQRHTWDAVAQRALQAYRGGGAMPSGTPEMVPAEIH